MEIFLGILLAIPLGLIPAFIAKGKGHSFGLWWFYGWALFIVAIIHVMFIEDKSVSQNNSFNSFCPPAPSPVQYSAVRPQGQNSEIIKKDDTRMCNKAEDLRALKELLDNEIITQDEFEIKKKQILNL